MKPLHRKQIYFPLLHSNTFQNCTLAQKIYHMWLQDPIPVVENHISPNIYCRKTAQTNPAFDCSVSDDYFRKTVFLVVSYFIYETVWVDTHYSHVSPFRTPKLRCPFDFWLIFYCKFNFSCLNHVFSHCSFLLPCSCHQ